MWRSAAAISVAAGMLVPGAATGAEQQKPAFEAVDADGNGKITLEQAREAGVEKEKARRQDLDDDGKLTRNDWKYVGYGGASG